LQIPLKEGIGGEREGDFMDNFYCIPLSEYKFYSNSTRLTQKTKEEKNNWLAFLLCGVIKAHLWVSSEGPQTDKNVKLLEVQKHKQTNKVTSPTIFSLS